MVDWKRIPKIDAHIHILPDDVITANQGVDDPYVLAGGAEEYIRLMEEYNISKAVIMPFNDPFLMSMEFTISAVHENLLDFLTQHGDRFLIFADIDVRNAAEDTIAELRRVMATGLFSGIKIHPTNTGLPLDDDYFDALFAYAEQGGIPIEIHSYPEEDDREDACAPKRLHRVLEKYPDLRLSVAHMGGFQFAKLCGLNVWVNISAVLPDMVARFGVKESNAILRMFDVDKLIFATDYPCSRSIDYEAIYPQYFEILNSMDFSEEEATAICRDNILRFLKIHTD